MNGTCDDVNFTHFTQLVLLHYLVKVETLYVPCMVRRVHGAVSRPAALHPSVSPLITRCRVTVLGKLFTPIVPLFTKQRNW